MKAELERYLREIERLAFGIPAPNPHTPQIVQAAIDARSALSQLEGARDETEALRREVDALEVDAQHHLEQRRVAEARTAKLSAGLHDIRDYIQRWSGGNALGESGTKLAIAVDDIARTALTSRCCWGAR